jgi:hypothetical protein
VNMKHLLFILSAIFFLLHASPREAFAQRTATGKPFIGLSAYVSAYAVPSGGVGIEGGQYLSRSYWKAGVRAVDWNQKIAGTADSGSPVHFDHILWNLSGAWMYRLAATYSRRFNLYVGGGAFVGLNHYEVFRKLPGELAGGFPKAEFVYGVEPAVDIEIFPFRRVAILIGIQSPLTFNSSLKTDLWHLSGSIGVRVNL